MGLRILNNSTTGRTTQDLSGSAMARLETSPTVDREKLNDPMSPKKIA